MPPVVFSSLYSKAQFLFQRRKKKKRRTRATFGSREANLNSIQQIGFYQKLFQGNRWNQTLFPPFFSFFFRCCRESTFDHMRWPYVPDQFIWREYGLSPDTYIHVQTVRFLPTRWTARNIRLHFLLKRDGWMDILFSLFFL